MERVFTCSYIIFLISILYQIYTKNAITIYKQIWVSYRQIRSKSDIILIDYNYMGGNNVRYKIYRHGI